MVCSRIFYLLNYHLILVISLTYVYCIHIISTVYILFLLYIEVSMWQDNLFSWRSEWRQCLSLTQTTLTLHPHNMWSCCPSHKFQQNHQKSNKSPREISQKKIIQCISQIFSEIPVKIQVSLYVILMLTEDAKNPIIE